MQLGPDNHEAPQGDVDVHHPPDNGQQTLRQVEALEDDLRTEVLRAAVLAERHGAHHEARRVAGKHHVAAEGGRTGREGSCP